LGEEIVYFWSVLFCRELLHVIVHDFDERL